MSAPKRTNKRTTRQAAAAERRAHAERAIEAWVQQTLAKAPPLTDAQGDLITRLLAPHLRQVIAERKAGAA